MNNIKEFKKQSDIIKGELKNIPPDTTLYINYPFCLKHCRFCIYKIHKYNKINSDYFIKYYNKEILLYAKELSGFKFKNIHIGGGTPNLVSPKLLISPLSKLVDFDNIERFVVEVYPRDDLEEYLKELKQYNVKKIQLGIQTLDERILSNENRPVSKKIMLNCFKVLSKSDFVWSVDLIYGLKDEDIFHRNYARELKSILHYAPHGFHLYDMRLTPRNGHYGEKNLQKKIYIKEVNYSEVEDILTKHKYEKIYDEWCIGENRKHALKTCNYNGGSGVFPDILGIGLGANSHFRFALYSTVKNLHLYKLLLNNNIIPIARFFNLKKNNLYPIANMYMEIKRLGRFNYGKFLKKANLSKAEERQMLDLFKLLRKHNFKLNSNKELIVSKSQLPECFYLIRKYMEARCTFSLI